MCVCVLQQHSILIMMTFRVIWHYYTQISSMIAMSLTQTGCLHINKTHNLFMPILQLPGHSNLLHLHECHWRLQYTISWKRECFIHNNCTVMWWQCLRLPHEKFKRKIITLICSETEIRCLFSINAWSTLYFSLMILSAPTIIAKNISYLLRNRGH